MAVTTYPHDPTGKLASNKVTNERHVLTAKNSGDFQFIVPKFAPFFRESVVLSFQPAGSSATRNLVLGKDYYFTHQFMEASKATALPVYGSITFLNPSIAGVVTLTSYQTLGGDWLIDEKKIQEILADNIHNPRTTSWDQVANLPYKYPVIDHEWDLVDMVGMSDVNGTLNSIERALRLKAESDGSGHALNTNNPHNVTKEQVGLGNLRNLPILTAANNGKADNSDNFYLTPKGMRMIADEYILKNTNSHIQARNNPHNVTAEQVNAYTKEQVNSLLQGYLEKEETAANSYKFNNMDATSYMQYVLAGTAANANTIDGLSVDQLIIQVRERVMSDVTTRLGNGQLNADTLGGYSLDQIKAMNMDNATRFNNKTELEWLALIRQQKVNDSARLNGKTESELVNSISASVSANANTLESKTLSEIKSEIRTELNGAGINAVTLNGKSSDTIIEEARSGTANNATLFNGKTQDDWVAIIASQTVANANAVFGKTETELLNDLKSEVGGNALTLEGKDLATIKEEIKAYLAVDFDAQTLGGMSLQEITASISRAANADAQTFSGKNETEWLELIGQQTVANANTVFGKDEDELANDILSRSINAATFNGKDEDTWLDLIRSQTVSNATSLNGKTEAELIGSLKEELKDAETLNGKDLEAIQNDIKTIMASEGDSATVGGNNLTQIYQQATENAKTEINKTIAQYTESQLAERIKPFMNLDNDYVPKFNILEGQTNGLTYGKLFSIQLNVLPDDEITNESFSINDTLVLRNAQFLTTDDTNETVIANGEYEIRYKRISETKFSELVQKTDSLTLEELGLSILVKNTSINELVDAFNKTEKPIFRAKLIEDAKDLEVYVLMKSDYQGLSGSLNGINDYLTIDGESFVEHDTFGEVKADESYQGSLPLIGFSQNNTNQGSLPDYTQELEKIKALENKLDELTNSPVKENVNQIDLSEADQDYYYEVNSEPVEFVLTNPPSEIKLHSIRLYLSIQDQQQAITWDDGIKWDSVTPPLLELNTDYLIELQGLTKNNETKLKAKITKM